MAGNFTLQKKMLEKALHLQEEEYGEEEMDKHVDVAITLENLSGACSTLISRYSWGIWRDHGGRGD